MQVLFCDSNCELWHTEIEKYGLKYIKMPYILDGREFYYDLGKTTDFKGFYDAVRQKSVPKTAALNVENYIEIFEPYAAKGDEVLYITFSHKMSATFEQLEKAISELKNKYPDFKIKLFDTQYISIGAANIVLQAAKSFKAGKSLQEIYEQLEHYKTHTCCAFTVNNLMHLNRGGRLSMTQALVGTIFNIKPLLSFKDGSLYSFQKAAGRKKAIAMLADMLVKYKVDKSKEVFIVHADSMADCELLKEKIVQHLGSDKNIVMQYVGPVIGSHCGPDTLGMAFSTLEPVQLKS